MLLTEITSVIPLKALAIQLGKFFAELSKAADAVCLEKDKHSFRQATANFDTEAPTLQFYVSFHSTPLPKPASFQVFAKKLLRDMKLKGFNLDYERNSEGDPGTWLYSFTVDIGDHLGNMTDDEFYAVIDVMTDSFKANIGTVNHEINN